MDLPPVNLDNNTDVTSTAVASDIDAKTGPVLSHQYLDDHMPGSFDDPDMRDMYAYLGHAAMKAAFEAIKERLDNGGVATEAERVRSTSMFILQLAETRRVLSMHAQLYV